MTWMLISRFRGPSSSAKMIDWNRPSVSSRWRRRRRPPTGACCSRSPSPTAAARRSSTPCRRCSASRPSRARTWTRAQCLYAPDLPDPDLIIRTSGEVRLSGLLRRPLAGLPSDRFPARRARVPAARSPLRVVASRGTYGPFRGSHAGLLPRTSSEAEIDRMQLEVREDLSPHPTSHPPELDPRLHGIATVIRRRPPLNVCIRIHVDDVAS